MVKQWIIPVAQVTTGWPGTSWKAWDHLSSEEAQLLCHLPDLGVKEKAAISATSDRTDILQLLIRGERSEDIQEQLIS